MGQPAFHVANDADPSEALALQQHEMVEPV
jgi:hypothetical protein